MTPSQIELARHALGLPNKRRTSYRNHFVTGPGSADYDDWMAMVDSFEAHRQNGSALSGGDPVFFLTQSGAESALKPGEKLSREDFPHSANGAP